MREIALRREKARRRRRLRHWSIASVLSLVLLALFLFSSPGPFGHLLFGSKQNEAFSEDRELEVSSGEANSPVSPQDTPDPAAKGSDNRPPCVAIVVDDVGNGDAHTQEWLSIDAPLTFAVMPYCELGPGQAERLHQEGFQVMLHVPTANAKPNSFSARGQLESGMDRSTVFSVLDADIAQIPHAQGINNHQGGAGCDDYALMRLMCEWAAERGLYVVDSNSSARSQVTAAMESLGMPRRRNQVFIDHDNDPDYIRGAMRKLADLARSNGTAIGICHWHRPNTARVVGEMVRALRAEGIKFAFVREISN